MRRFVIKRVKDGKYRIWDYGEYSKRIDSARLLHHSFVKSVVGKGEIAVEVEIKEKEGK